MALQAGTLFPEELVTEMFSKVQGRSSIAKLSADQPIPFNGKEEFIFNLEGNAEIVGEGGQKHSSNAAITSKIIKPVKIVYQSRVSDEFINASEEARIPYLQSFAEGFSKKIAEAIDIASFHGLEPRSMAEASFYATNSFDGEVTQTKAYAAATLDDIIDEAVQVVAANGYAVNGIAMSPTAGSALAKIKVNGVVQYPEFRFGQNPDAFYGMASDVNRTVPMRKTGATTSDPTDHVILGDFDAAFQWGYAKQIPLEVIEYGDPDQTGRDLKAYNEVCLRSEVYVGWGILDPDAFALIQA